MGTITIAAYVSGEEKLCVVKEEVALALKGLCGAPDESSIHVGVMTGRVQCSFRFFISSEIPEIRKRLEACNSLEGSTIQIAESKVVLH